MRRITLFAIVFILSLSILACVENPDKEENQEGAANTNSAEQAAKDPDATSSAGSEDGQGDGTPPIIKAASDGDTIMVTSLIDTGTDVNTRNRFGVTPLMAASAKGHLETINVLLAQGADVKAKDNKGLTARDYAANNSKYVVVELLNAHGGDQ